MSQVYTIIVTYNGEQWIEKCLDRLLKSETQSQVIVVDNASSDRTLPIVRAFGTSVHLIENSENLGFGQANNTGVRYAFEKGANYFLLLNQDAFIFPDTIKQLVEALAAHPDFGILSPLQLDVSGEKPEPIFMNFLRKALDEQAIQKILQAAPDVDMKQPVAVRFVNAAAWMLSRECVTRAGLFHPVFFHYGEDNHYSSRVQSHGLKVGVLPAARVIHDCKKETAGSHELLIRQMKNVPLYTLLDLRKPFWIAYLLGLQKWSRLRKKLKKYNDPDDHKIVADQLRWFSDKLTEAKQIRRETSAAWAEKESG